VKSPDFVNYQIAQENSRLALFFQYERQLMASYANLLSNRMAEQPKTGGVPLSDLLTLIFRTLTNRRLSRQ